MDKIKIAFFLPSLEAGGAERIVVNIVNRLDGQKYAVSLVLAEAKGDFLSDIEKDVPIINLNVLGSLKLFFRLIKYFRNNKTDIFISAFPRINIICILAKIFSGTSAKIIITEQSVFSRLPLIAKTATRRFFAYFFMPFLAKIIYPKADKIICSSAGIADDLLNIIGCKEKLRVIYNPIINDKIYELAKETLGEDEHFLKTNKPVIIAVGRLVRAKDYPTLLKAFGLVIRKQSAQLVILGEGPEEKSLVKLANELGLFENIAFMGFQKNPYKFLANAKIFVLSSIVEGFPTVIVEAMACGAPVVSTNCQSGPNEIIEDGKNGLLVPVGDEKALAEAVLKLLNDKELREKFSNEGKKVSQKFSFEKSIQEYENIFREILK